MQRANGATVTRDHRRAKALLENMQGQRVFPQLPEELTEEQCRYLYNRGERLHAFIYNSNAMFETTRVFEIQAAISNHPQALTIPARWADAIQRQRDLDHSDLPLPSEGELFRLDTIQEAARAFEPPYDRENDQRDLGHSIFSLPANGELFRFNIFQEAGGIFQPPYDRVNEQRDFGRSILPLALDGEHGDFAGLLQVDPNVMRQSVPEFEERLRPPTLQERLNEPIRDIQTNPESLRAAIERPDYQSVLERRRTTHLVEDASDILPQTMDGPPRADRQLLAAPRQEVRQAERPAILIAPSPETSEAENYRLWNEDLTATRDQIYLYTNMLDQNAALIHPTTREQIDQDLIQLNIQVQNLTNAIRDRLIHTPMHRDMIVANLMVANTYLSEIMDALENLMDPQAAELAQVPARQGRQLPPPTRPAASGSSNFDDDNRIIELESVLFGDHSADDALDALENLMNPQAAEPEQVPALLSPPPRQVPPPTRPAASESSIFNNDNRMIERRSGLFGGFFGDRSDDDALGAADALDALNALDNLMDLHAAQPAQVPVPLSPPPHHRPQRRQLPPPTRLAASESSNFDDDDRIIELENMLLGEQSDDGASSVSDDQEMSDVNGGWSPDDPFEEPFSPRFYHNTSLFGFDPRNNEEFDDESGSDRGGNRPGNPSPVILIVETL